MKFIKVTLLSGPEIKISLINIEEIRSLTPNYTTNQLVDEKDKCNGTVISFRNDGRYIVEESIKEIYDQIYCGFKNDPRESFDIKDLSKIGDLKEYKKEE